MKNTKRKPIFLSEPVEVPAACTCTFKPYAHPQHRQDKDEYIPWNWDKTHKIWAKQEKAKPELFQ